MAQEDRNPYHNRHYMENFHPLDRAHPDHPQNEFMPADANVPKRNYSNTSLTDLLPTDYEHWTGNEEPSGAYSGQITGLTGEVPARISSFPEFWEETEYKVVVYVAQYVIDEGPGRPWGTIDKISRWMCMWSPSSALKFGTRTIMNQIIQSRTEKIYDFPPISMQSIVNHGKDGLIAILQETVANPDLLQQPNDKHAWIRNHLMHNSPLFWPLDLKIGLAKEYLNIELSVRESDDGFPTLKFLDYVQARSKELYGEHAEYATLKGMCTEKAVENFIMMAMWEHIGFDGVQKSFKYYTGRLEETSEPPSKDDPFWEGTNMRKWMKELSVFEALKS